MKINTNPMTVHVISMVETLKECIYQYFGEELLEEAHQGNLKPHNRPPSTMEVGCVLVPTFLSKLSLSTAPAPVRLPVQAKFNGAPLAAASLAAASDDASAPLAGASALLTLPTIVQPLNEPSGALKEARIARARESYRVPPLTGARDRIAAREAACTLLDLSRVSVPVPDDEHVNKKAKKM